MTVKTRTSRLRGRSGTRKNDELPRVYATPNEGLSGESLLEIRTTTLAPRK